MKKEMTSGENAIFEIALSILIPIVVIMGFFASLT